MAFSGQGILNDSQIVLERQGTEAFGQAVEDFGRGGFGVGLPQFSEVPPANKNDPKQWVSTSYAAALAGSNEYRPKLKFLFKVKFNFNPVALNKLSQIYAEQKLDSASIKKMLEQNDFTFMVKMVDRPKINFEYEEDVNMYNFRTKVLKKIHHRELTIQFMDDTGNKVFDFYRTLMMIHSPITRRQILRDGTLKRPDPSTITVGSGMNYKGDKDNAHRAVVDSSFGNSIDSIQVQQIFVGASQAANSLQQATQMVSFDFMNPRITSFDFDELAHEANDFSSLTMIFDYDWMEMVKVGVLGTNNTKYESEFKNIQMPGGATVDLSPYASSGSPQKSGIQAEIASVFGRYGGELTRDTIGKAVQTVAGNDRFGQALGGQVTGVLGNSVGSYTQSVVNGLSLPRADAAPVTDSSIPGGSPNVSVTSSYPPY